MKAIVTGDIIESGGATNPEVWSDPLKKTLEKWGKTPAQWEIFRGDSFQLSVDAADGLRSALHIQSSVVAAGNFGVRMSIGIGDETYSSAKITESTGSAYVNSGRAFDQLKKRKRKLIFSSPWPEADRDFNIIFLLLDRLTENWTQASAETMQLYLERDKIPQTELAEILGISQPSVSSRLRVAHANEIMQVLSYFEERIKELQRK